MRKLQQLTAFGSASISKVVCFDMALPLCGSSLCMSCKDETIELDLSEMDGTPEFMDAVLEALRTAAEVEPRFYIRVVAHAWESGYKDQALAFAEQGVRGQSVVANVGMS